MPPDTIVPSGSTGDRRSSQRRRSAVASDAHAAGDADATRDRRVPPIVQLWPIWIWLSSLTSSRSPCRRSRRDRSSCSRRPRNLADDDAADLRDPSHRPPLPPCQTRRRRSRHPRARPRARRSRTADRPRRWHAGSVARRRRCLRADDATRAIDAAEPMLAPAPITAFAPIDARLQRDARRSRRSRWRGRLARRRRCGCSSAARARRSRTASRRSAGRPWRRHR